MSDYIVRATAADGQIRAFAANTKDVVETARKDHNKMCIRDRYVSDRYFKRIWNRRRTDRGAWLRYRKYDRTSGS